MLFAARNLLFFYHLWNKRIYCAQEPDLLPIQSGISDDGISYQVYGSTLSTTANSITVSRTIIYEGEVAPPRTTTWVEYIDGVRYSSTIQLSSLSYDYDTNKTTAVYYGTLISQS